MTLGHTKIPYLDRLWHPTTGCSMGCPTCWARPLVCDRLAGTMKGLAGKCAACDGTGSRWHSSSMRGGCMSCANTGTISAFTPTFHSDRLDDPLRARKPQVIGVSFLGDLFDPAITDEQIAAVFGMMAACPQHTFVVLTKRAERMERWFAWAEAQGEGLADGSGEAVPASGSAIPSACAIFCDDFGMDMATMLRAAIPAPWPLPNVWLGVSVTNQADADERVGRLLRTPAAHRWVSAEPLVGAVDRMPLDGVDLVIGGGESGPGARPCHPDWARALRDQCAAAGVPFHWKQWNGTKATGRLLDGQIHDDLPWRRR